MTVDGVWVRPRRVPGRLGAISVTRLIALQLIQVALLASLLQGGWVAVAGGLTGVLATGAGFARWRGRWLTEHATIWYGYRSRRSSGRDEATDPRLTALGELVPDLLVESVPPAGSQAGRWGMGSDGAGWFAVLELVADRADRADPADRAVQSPVPLSALARVAAEAEQPGVVVQVVSQTESGPEPGSRQHRRWVAVRLAAHTVAASMVDHPDHRLDVPAVLGEITRRVGRVLRRRGLAARVLDADGLLDALVGACDLAPAGLAWPARETWRAWHSRRLEHRCFWLRTWPDQEHGTELLSSLAELPGVRASIALVLAPPGDQDGATDLRCLVRLAAEPGRCRPAADYAQGLAERLGGWLVPLDGEQALAVYGTAPSGGGPA